MSHRSLMWVAALVAVACTVPVSAQTSYPRSTLSETTPRTLEKDYALEREGKRPPRVGLSLAGGGTRAGQFAHGVLQGFNDTGLLDKVDAISSVSGGSYAAYWYFTKRLESEQGKFAANAMFADCLPKWWVKTSHPTTHEQTLIKLMDLAEHNRSPALPVCANDVHWAPGDPYRWQAHLARWPDVFQLSPGTVTGNKQSSPLLTTAGFVPATLIEFVVGPLTGTTAIPAAYHYGLERVWGLNPAERRFVSETPTWKDDGKTNWQYSNQQGKQWDWNLRADPERGSWDELKTATSGKSVFPLWIVNATQGQKEAGKPNPDHIYEMTAFGHGSRRLGYINESPKVMGVGSLGTGMLASAAVADAQNTTSKALRSMMKLHRSARWGVDIDNRFQHDKANAKFRLSDGGGSENLGLYSLIKRGIPDIIVVDDAMDMTGRMDDLCWAKKALSNEGLTMRFDALKQLDEVCQSYFEGGEKSQLLAYNTSAWLNPVIEGSVTWPVRADGTSMPKTRLWLIKLGWNQQDFRRAFNAEDCGSAAHPVNCLLTVYYGHNTKTLNKQDGYMVFPYLSTLGATFNDSSYLFWAYRELGRMVTTRLQWSEEEGGRLKLDPGVKQCDQLAILIPKNSQNRPRHKPASIDADKGCQ